MNLTVTIDRPGSLGERQDQERAELHHALHHVAQQVGMPGGATSGDILDRDGRKLGTFRYTPGVE